MAQDCSRIFGLKCILLVVSFLIRHLSVLMLQGVRFKKIAPPNAERLAASAAEDAIK